MDNVKDGFHACLSVLLSPRNDFMTDSLTHCSFLLFPLKNSTIMYIKFSVCLCFSQLHFTDSFYI